MRKSRLFTPGPTPVPEEVLLELAKPVTYHRTAEQRRIFSELLDDMKHIYQTSGDVICLTSSGTGGMEAAVSNIIAPGDKAILLTAGRWGERWKGVLNAFGANLVTVEFPYGQAVPPDALAEALAKHPDTVAVYGTLSETSTGVGHDVEGYGKIVAKTDALLCIDSISGLGAVECRTDAWGVDINVTGSQKALMMPPGLGFVSVSAKAWKRIDAKKGGRSFYFDLKRYQAKLAEGDTPFTSANTLVKAQRKATAMVREEGIENVWARHAKIANACRAGVQALGLELYAQRPNNGLTVITVPNGVDGNAVLSHIEKKYGYKPANGQDNLKGKIWRLSHMGYCDFFDIIGALSAMELTLKDLGHKVELGAGVAAAQKAYG